jgi:hypothetical protein
MTTPVADQIRDQLDQLTPENQQHVLDYVRQLLLVQSGHPSSKLLRYAGLIPDDDLERIERAIEEYEERVPQDE